MLEHTGTDLEAGWLPIGVDSGSGQTCIEWADFGSEPLAEPLLSQSVARLRAQATRSRLKFTALDALLQITPDVLPRGFIFHVSRCGSTLVSNSMRAFSGISVIAEPAVFAPLLMSFLPAQLRRLDDTNSVPGEALFRGAMAAFGRRRVGNETGLILKFSSWQILALENIRRLRPQVPCLVVIRDPVEILVSCLRKSTGWMRLQGDPVTTGKLFEWSPEELGSMSTEGFCARVIARYFETAALMAGTTCRVIDYSDLSTRRILDIAAGRTIRAKVEQWAFDRYYALMPFASQW